MMQDALPRAERRKVLEQLLVTAVSQLGVPINECADKDWLAPLLRFAPGMGPRKADHVIRVRSHHPYLRHALQVGMVAACCICA